jgi:hypothetical protein
MECPEPKTWADVADSAIMMVGFAIMFCAAMWASAKRP